MPSYTSHILFNFAAALTMLFFYQMNPFLTDMQLAWTIIGYFFGSVILTPDLDSPKSKPARNLIFRPFTLLSNHRGLSHDTLVGTLLRVIYVVIIISIAVILYEIVITKSINSYNFDTLIYLTQTHWEEILGAIGGLFIANTLHILIDKLF